MSSTRNCLVAACALLVPLVACGGSSKGDDDPIDSGGGNTTEGTHYGYVVSKAYVPVSNPQAADWGLDIGAAKSGTPDGAVDNVLGQAFGTLATQGFDIQGTITEAIDHGSINLLLDLQTKDFTNATNVGLTVKIGATSTPAACSGPADTTCRHQLDGTASFTLAAGSPTDVGVVGAIASGTFNGGPGNLGLQIAVGSTEPIPVTLHNARAKSVSISPTAVTTILAGALTVSDLNTHIIPAIQATIAGLLDADCGPVASRNPAMDCSCSETSSKLILGLFDGGTAADPVKNCVVSVEEILQSNFIKAVLAADICSTATCAAPDALSLGIKVDSVKATFPM